MRDALVSFSVPLGLFVCVALARQPAGSPVSPPPPPAASPELDDRGPPPREDRRPGDERRRGGDRFDSPLLRESASHDPKLLKDIIDRMLEQNNRIEKRLLDAKTKLEAGTPPEEVFRMLREARAGNMADVFFQNWRERREEANSQGPMFDKPKVGPGGGPDPQQREELMQFIREIRPEFAAKLEEWQKSEPRAFRAVIGHLLMQAVDTFHERDRDVQLYELRKEDLRTSILVVEKSTEVRAIQMSEPKGQADSEKLTKAKAELRELMGKGYDARVRVREYEADKLAKRLDETRSRIQETKDVREQMIDKAVTQLLERKRVSPQPGDGPANSGERQPQNPGADRRPEPGPR